MHMLKAGKEERGNANASHSFDSQSCNAKHGCSSHSQHKLSIRKHEINGCANPIVIFLAFTASIHPCHPVTEQRQYKEKESDRAAQSTKITVLLY